LTINNKLIIISILLIAGILTLKVENTEGGIGSFYAKMPILGFLTICRYGSQYYMIPAEESQKGVLYEEHN